MGALAHVDDPGRANIYTKLTQTDSPTYEALTDRERRLARMLFFVLWPDKGGFSSYEEGLRHLRRHPAVGAELRELVALGLDRARYLPRSLGEGLQQVPLASHAHYRREEILPALGWATIAAQRTWQRHQRSWADRAQTDALMINLRKSEKTFHRRRCIAISQLARPLSLGI